MGKRVRPPANEEELKQLEAEGLWRAIALSRTIAERRDPLTIDVLRRLHTVLMEKANPGIAGHFRVDGEDVRELHCMTPPPGRVVSERIHGSWMNIEERLAAIPLVTPIEEDAYEGWVDSIFDLATTVQYEIASIHPFCDGNGRMARLFTNMVLMRFGVAPSRVKFEGENKQAYLNALCQIDKYGDYEPLRNIIIGGAIETLEKEEKRRREAQQG